MLLFGATKAAILLEPFCIFLSVFHVFSRVSHTCPRVTSFTFTYNLVERWCHILYKPLPSEDALEITDPPPSPLSHPSWVCVHSACGRLSLLACCVVPLPALLLIFGSPSPSPLVVVLVRSRLIECNTTSSLSAGQGLALSPLRRGLSVASFSLQYNCGIGVSLCFPVSRHFATQPFPATISFFLFLSSFKASRLEISSVMLRCDSCADFRTFFRPPKPCICKCCAIFDHSFLVGSVVVHSVV